MAYRGKDLAGTCGIPRHDERVYVGVNLGKGEHGQIVRPVRLVWPDGRSWHVESARPVAEFGREMFGNLVVRWEITIARRTKALWQDQEGWFVKTKAACRRIAAREEPRRERA